MLHSCRIFAEDIFNEYAAQTMFFQSQAVRTKKNPEKARFCLTFIDFQKKPEFQNLASKKPIWQPCCKALLQFF